MRLSEKPQAFNLKIRLRCKHLDDFSFPFKNEKCKKTPKSLKAAGSRIVPSLALLSGMEISQLLQDTKKWRAGLPHSMELHCNLCNCN